MFTTLRSFMGFAPANIYFFTQFFIYKITNMTLLFQTFCFLHCKARGLKFYDNNILCTDYNFLDSLLNQLHHHKQFSQAILSIHFIVKIDSTIWSFCLRHYVQKVYLIWARKLYQHCANNAKLISGVKNLISDKINISFYTELQALRLQ